MHLRPELIDREANEPGRRPDYYGLAINDLSVAAFERAPVAVYFDMEEISPNGSMGDSTVASADKGRAILGGGGGRLCRVRRAFQADQRPPGRRATHVERLAVRAPRCP